ncbi:hypothetical protein C7U92_28365 [Bradyrhizobium sp. WBOS7]|uniref:Uncharacterized protein n=1 Tax=Bradyrhizobium betae TaxID=244734 RepID=A0AAE9N6L6_9BRAD|nr:hypothetical protein [Bradyrhizobium sp. WBOS2]MDD1574568.1 hypothetical protein [Bradyrhizobium sp. WBOS1]MDD1580604.1 hypothetical protein [Bradyrhizobium sp. WBOS7]MDD1603846.1 hypothetical protein [Bradyrhizobium sp. WBOS16]UUO34738.1 hypothetical protein DCK84_09275 [Bradyrhizobium sp. WBOS01]UUO41066.1 hypothetical protein DCM75_10125 [Bradyrhizobium sp. WBOS02]UUO55384.1 hypothetical protein DCM79_21820 [Bradyrhizobium sp. WBOS07]UUO65436.1 hypothetical protein DCM83_09605 [Bradyrh
MRDGAAEVRIAVDRNRLGRNGFADLVVELVIERGEHRQRLGRQRDRLAAARQRRRGFRRALPRQRIERRADTAAVLDQIALGAARCDHDRQRMQMVAAIAEQRQPGACVRGNTLNQPRQATLAGAVHLAKEFVANRAEIAFKGVAA